MATTPLQSITTPDASSTNNVPSDLLAVATALESRTVMRFASTSARDAAITSPVEGMVAVTGTGSSLVAWLRVGSTWVAFPAESTADVATFGTGWSATDAAGHKPRVRSIGDLVLLTGAVTRTGSGAASNLLTIPAGFVPVSTATRFVGTSAVSGGSGGTSGVAPLAMASGVLSIIAGAGYGSTVALGTSAIVPVTSMWWRD